MNPKSIIIRHPGRVSFDAMQCMREEIRRWLGSDVPVLVLTEGMKAWILGDDGKIYDLCNAGSLVEGNFDEIKALPTWTDCEAVAKTPL